MLIDTSGVFTLPTQSYGQSTVYVSGSLGGSSAYLKCNGVVLEDGTVEAGKAYVVTHGKGADLTLVVEGGAGIACTVRVNGVA